MTTTHEASRAEAKLTRRFNAPRSLVFDVWSTPELLARWFGPRGFTMKIHAMEFRPGGPLNFSFIGPDGTDYPCNGTYVEIVPNERIVWTAGFPYSPKPDQIHTTVTFAERDGQTEVHVHQIMSPVTPETAPHAAGMQMGWEQTIDRLAELVDARIAEQA